MHHQDGAGLCLAEAAFKWKHLQECHADVSGFMLGRRCDLSDSEE